MLLHRFYARRHALLAESRALLGLAIPMMVAQIAQVATGFVDTVMAGRVGTADLAAVSIGASVLITVTISLAGMVMALNPIISHHFGADERHHIASSVRQGLWNALLLGGLGAGGMLLFAVYLPDILSLSPQVEAMTYTYLVGAATGVPAFLLYRVFHACLSSINLTRPIMVTSLVALALNVPLNYVFIHGLWGLPALGGAGCGWATAMVYWFSLFVLAGYCAWSSKVRPLAIFSRFEWPSLALQRTIVRLGTPIAFSFFLEVSAFTFVAMLITPFGETVVAGHQVVINFSALIYMIPQSLATALSVRVGQTIGAGDYVEARFKSGAGLLTGLVLALITSALVLVGNVSIASIYSTDPAVIALAAHLLLFSAVFQFSDAAQTIASGALRGYRITSVPMMIHAVSFWGIGLGLGVILGLMLPVRPEWGWSGPLGVEGFWAALVLSLTVAAVLLVWYLNRISRLRLIRQH